MVSWTTRLGEVLAILEPITGPRPMLERLWQEVESWRTITGIRLSCHPGHLSPAGVFLVGLPLPEVIATPSRLERTNIHGRVAEQEILTHHVRDGNVTIAVILVGYTAGAAEAATFLAEAVSRWCIDRLRMQLHARELAEENHSLRGALTPQLVDEPMTNSGSMHSLFQSAIHAAASDATVLIRGETGTGKELLARFIHGRSTRAHMPLVSVNAGALSPGLVESELFGHVAGAFTGAEHDRKGLFEVADGATLFLDEIGELTLDVQVRLLRTLQDRTIMRVGDHVMIPVDIRIIAATHRDLLKEIQLGRFREDLYYRLNVVELHLPPLRERMEDLPLLVESFLKRFNHQHHKSVDTVPREVLEILGRYQWPGNIRELENCIQKAVVLAPGRVFLEDLISPAIRAYTRPPTVVPGTAPVHAPAAPAQVPESTSPRLASEEDELHRAVSRYISVHGTDLQRLSHLIEPILIARAIERAKGVKARAAMLLGINRGTLVSKMSQYGILEDAAKPGQDDLV